MKKVLALLLALTMAVALFACKPADKTTPTPDAPVTAAPDGDDTPPVTTGKAYPHANADGSLNLNTVAHYDPEYDYTQNEKFKVAYLATENSFLYQMAADAYAHWAPIFNLDWQGFQAANSDSDLFLTNLRNLIDQGVKGFVLDPDTTVFPAILEILEQYPDVQWMSQMAPPRDGASGAGLPIGGNLINPYVGFDNFDAGAQQIYKLIEWKEANLKDVPYEEIGLLSMGFSTSPPLQERVIGAKAAWESKGVKTDGPNYFEVDTASAGLTLNGGLEAVTPVISTHGEYKYWLVMGLIDDLGQAAAQVIDQQGLTDSSCVVTFGGSGFIAMWDGGAKNACRYALYTANNLYSEPILGAVYAYLMGWATPDTIWPEWVKWDDKGAEGRSIPQLRLPTVWLEQDDYKHYLEWSDLYAKANEYNYDVPGLTLDDYSAFIPVPADFAKP
ncbi:MAG: substrate-binding domain-containing protein [Oscillospiraceae bacterium]|jgi:ABC-type sugar transport system substrate-binding protein|nr:substrate-binding domain-containing protein [Oscillospiraceae bacterium]